MLKELMKKLSEAKQKSEIVFEIFDGEELIFTARGDSGADQIDKKLTQKKFKNKKLKIMRNQDGDYKDITKLFIK